MIDWTGAAAGITNGALALAFVVAGVWLVRGGRPGARDHEHWFLGSVLLLIIAAADRLTMLDGQLLSLAALLMLWWNAVKRSEDRRTLGMSEGSPERIPTSPRADPLRATPLGGCGFGFLVGETAGLGLLTIALVISQFVAALRSAPGGWAALSWFDSLAIVAEVAHSQPSLRGLSLLAPTAWLAGAVAVAILWITILPDSPRRIISRLVGALLLGGGVAVAVRLIFR